MRIGFRVARPERFELPTLCFEGRCSIQLSYGRVVEVILILKHLPPFQNSNPPLSAVTVPELSLAGKFWHSLPVISLAWRLSFSRASRFICNFICEYFLTTWESPCRSICVTHSSATPPALKRVAYVDRRS